MRDPGNKVSKEEKSKLQLEEFLIDDVIVPITKSFCHRLLPGYQFSRASKRRYFIILLNFSTSLERGIPKAREEI